MNNSMSFALNNNKCVLASNATKQLKYECPDCMLPVFVRQGQINRHHFAHFSDSKCDYYERVGESHTHKSAKFFLKNQLENTKIKIETHCCGCKSITCKEFEKFDQVIIEYKLKDNKRADVAGILEDKVIVFEVLFTHATLESARQGYEWYELLANDILSGSTILVDKRTIQCKECITKSENRLKEYNQRQIEREAECKQRLIEDEQRKRLEHEQDKRKRLEHEQENTQKQLEHEQENTQKRLEYEQERLIQELEYKQKLIEREQQDIQKRLELAQQRLNQELEFLKYNNELKEAEKKKQIHYDTIYDEYICEIVKPRNFDKTLTCNNFIYKGCNFLYPSHILRFNPSW